MENGIPPFLIDLLDLTYYSYILLNYFNVFVYIIKDIRSDFLQKYLSSYIIIPLTIKNK